MFVVVFILIIFITPPSPPHKAKLWNAWLIHLKAASLYIINKSKYKNVHPNSKVIKLFSVFSLKYINLVPQLQL